MHLPSLLVFAFSDPGFSARLVSPPSQSKSIQLRVDSLRPSPSVAVSCKLISLPCHIVARRVPSLRCRLAARRLLSTDSMPCRIDSARSALGLSVSVRCHAVRSSPCSSVSQHRRSYRSIRFVSFPFPRLSQLSVPCPSRLRRCASDRRVSSALPAFPLLIHEAPSLSLPWPIHSMLYLAMRFHRPAGRFQTVLFRILASALRALPLRFMACPYHALPERLRSCPVLAVPWHFSSRRICEAPFHLCPCRIVSPRLHSLSTRISSPPSTALSHDRFSLLCHCTAFPASLCYSMPCRFISFAVVAMPCQLFTVVCPSWLLTCSPFRIIGHPVPASPFLFLAPAFAAIPLRCRSDQSLARQFSAFASLFWSLPCHFVSTHLRLCRSWPFLCCSLPVRAEPCPFLSIPLGSIPFRVRSDPFASARLGSVAARCSTCPSVSMPSPC